MRASASYSILIIAVCALCTFGERLLPFLIFGKHKVPRMVRYLGRGLPMAIMTALVVYCLRTTAFTSLSAWLPQLAAAAFTAALHLWKGNTLLSITGGTACYMLLLRLLG